MMDLQKQHIELTALTGLHLLHEERGQITARIRFEIGDLWGKFYCRTPDQAALVVYQMQTGKWETISFTKAKASSATMTSAMFGLYQKFLEGL
jgi:hypothetical protein